MPEADAALSMTREQTPKSGMYFRLVQYHPILLVFIQLTGCALQDKFSTYPGIQDILAQVKADKAARKERLEIYYNDDRLADLVKPVQSQTTNGDVGVEKKDGAVETTAPTTIDVTATTNGVESH